MDFNFDTGAIYNGVQTIDVTTLPPLGGQAGVLTITGSGALTLPAGTTAEQPTSPVAAMLRYNNDVTALEYYNGTTWAVLSVGGGTVTSVAATGSTGLVVGGSPVTSSGTLTFTLDTGLQNLATFSSTGIVVATGTDTWSAVTITGTSSNIVVTNGSAVSGNPTIDLATLGTPVTSSFVKITTDTHGRVSATTPVVTADITSLVDSTYVNVSGDTMASGANLTFVGGGEILGLPTTPTTNSSATSKAYVDSVAAGLSWKQAVIVATTTDINLAVGGLLAIDGVTVADGYRVLVKNQNTSSQNGLYIAHAGAWIRSTDMNSTSPNNEFNGAAVFVEQGTVQNNTGWTQINNVTVVGTDPVIWAQYSGSGTYLAGTGLTLTGNTFSLSSPVTPNLGGTGTTTVPTAGQLLIGTTGGIYAPSTLTAGTAISINSITGAITINNTGVTSIAGTIDQIDVSSSTGAVTLSLPSSVSIGDLTLSGLTPNSFLYSGTAGLLTTTSAPTDGQILIGSTGSAPVAASITAGTGVSIVNAAGSITLNNTGVTSVNASGGTTGLTFTGGPVTTTGTLTLAGTLSVANGGTGLTSLGSANQVLGVNAAGTASEYKTVSAGTGISVTDGTGVITIVNTGVTSVALTAPSIFTVSGSPVTTTGTLDFSLNAQSANTVFSGPSTGSAAVPTFRTLAYADLPIKLYVENPSSPVAPVASGTNSVAIGSGATSSAIGAIAEGSGSNATIIGQKAFANGSFATAGDAQQGIYVLRNITTTNSATELFLDGITGTQRLVVGNNSVWTFTILVTGRRTDATGGGAGYKFEGVVRKDTTTGSITFVGTPSKTVLGETDAAWDAVLTANTTDGDLRITVTGQNAKTIRWVATVTTVQVTN